MNLYSIDARALASLMALLGDDCPRGTWDPNGTNREVLIIPGSPDNKLQLGEGGFSRNTYLWFETLVSAWGYDDPQLLKNAILETTFRYLQHDFKITDVNVRGGGYKVMIECNSLQQNA